MKITEVWGQPIVLIFNDQEIKFYLILDPEDGIERLFRNVGKDLPIFAEYYRRGAQIFAVAIIMEIQIGILVNTGLERIWKEGVVT